MTKQQTIDKDLTVSLLLMHRGKIEPKECLIQIKHIILEEVLKVMPEKENTDVHICRLEDMGYACPSEERNEALDQYAKNIRGLLE